MFAIGEFARHGRVSVRMLRHYDALGLLRPALVDDRTGYRFYEAAQLARLNRIVALKALGFTLEQVREIVDAKVGAEELRGMLRLRRAQLAAEAAATTARLQEVEGRLRIIESEGLMPVNDVVVKSLPAERVARLTAGIQDMESQFIGPVLGPLFQQLCDRIAAAGAGFRGPAIATYEETPGGDHPFVVHACMPIGDQQVPADAGFEVVVLPAVARAATVVHHGHVQQMMPAFQTLAHWLDAGGGKGVGFPREVNLDIPEDMDEWVTEIQQPLADAEGGAA
ncbi:MerR family transcriptional regulator [Mangrovactinospora gilvigrisea]|uniref:MerR family transcriptional regulator n=1 Tax=Mangrovactinospora gilvigrisea TaxID=1428644 RepID=A0A1J7CHG7_9ACTN|nr:MerR family transcriptional regulator [Mangrovactinospora gilvigrisea]OIV39082.1 MerR family transcriptional regulator [Mangrovactinospora gilvigrisea]